VRALKGFLVTLRPEQWTKNLVLFAGLIFAGGLGRGELVRLAGSGFLIFCVLSGAMYVLNDLADIRRDREHPDKRTRPLASGELPAAPAAVLAGIGAVLAVLWAYRVYPGFGHVALAYLILNVLYSAFFRRMVILDVMSIAIGFVLRAVGSVEVLRGAAPATELSPWLLVCKFFLALFLGFGKRRHEALILGGSAAAHRSTLEHYPPELLDAVIGVVTAATVVSYAIYTIWPGTVEKVGSAGLVYTVPFVVYGVLRYLYLMFARCGGGKPARSLVSDAPLAINIALWVAVVIAIIYGR
jgi:4-hydroxybenzoate polyprenyltransferase